MRQYASQLRDVETLLITDCSAMMDRADLRSHLDGRIAGRTTVILDEVQAVEGWHLALRSLHSEGRLAGARVICTGSEARHLLESGERLPGRRGGGRTFFARPWSFREFADFFWPDAGRPLATIRLRHVNQHWLDDQPPRLEEAWRAYLTTGGFPKAVGEWHKTGKVSDATLMVYADWILGTWSRLRTPERSLAAVARRLVETLNSRVSHETLRKGTDIQSANTVRTLIDLQEDHLALRVVPRLDPQTGRFLPAKLRKLYPLDPFVARVLAAIGSGYRREPTELAADPLAVDECGFHAQTYRYGEFLPTGFVYSDRTHGEIDFYVDGVAFELKSNGRPTAAQRALLSQLPARFVVPAAKLPIVAYLLGEGRKPGIL